ncbi:MAG: methyltransferase domain-containing protein [Candidatus Aminicenantes bacterium]|nr:MAG: methyltransferase domain-containing protein [Candidatus Aminicenantes bacterium]
MKEENFYERELTLDEFALIVGGHTAFQLLWAGVQFNVFSLLSKQPQLLEEEIAEEIGLQPQPAKILLNGLTALKLIKKNKTKKSYKNAPLVEKLLTPQSPGNLVDVLGWKYHIVYPAEIDLVESLKKNKNIGLRHFPGKGNTLYERLASHPELEEIFHKAMSSITGSVNKILAQKLDLTHFKHLLDMGGGDGSNAIELAKANPHLKVTIFDNLTVCKQAEIKIAEAGLSQQIDVLPGDFFNDEFPGDVDCILFAHILTIWSADKNIKLLKRTYAALQKGGMTCILNVMSSDDGIGPVSAALGSPYFQTIATGEGMIYPKKEFKRFLKAAGYKKIRKIELPINHCLITGIK